MFALDQWQEVFQSLRRNRLRTFLTACGVFWGVFMLVAMQGFSSGLERGATESMGRWAQNTVFIWGDRTAKAYAGRQPGRRIQLRDQDTEALRARVPGLELVLPRNTAGGYGGRAVVSRKDKSESFSVSGDLPEYLRLDRLLIDRGRFLDPQDGKELRKVAVIGQRVRELLFSPSEDPIGQTVRANNVQFTVVGVFHSPAKGEMADWENARVFVPLRTFRRAFAGGDKVDYFALLVAPEASAEKVEQDVYRVLKQRHRVHPDDPRAIGGFNRAKEWSKMRGLFFGIGAVTWVVGVFTLLAGVLGVSNIMMIAVAERTKEIGVRKAMGATPGRVLAQILQETVVLTSLAGYLGLVAGVAVLELVGRLLAALPDDAGGAKFFGRPEIDFSRALIAIAFLTVAGAVAGLAPARSALAIRPAVALAHE